MRVLLTEKEAMEKRCCGPEGCGSQGCGSLRLDERYCIGSQCMAWRWAHWTSLDENNTADTFVPSDGHGPPRLQPTPPPGDGWQQEYPHDKRQWFGWTNWRRYNYDDNGFGGARGCCGYAPDQRFTDIERLQNRLERKLAKLDDE